MSTVEGDLLQEAIRRTLQDRAGPVPDARTVADATLRTWDQVAARLIPVIGARGVDALFGRALHLTCQAFPWLEIGGQRANPVDAMARIRTRLEQRKSDAAEEASRALLVTFTQLLSNLIGTSLTARLLDPVWDSPSATKSEERVP